MSFLFSLWNNLSTLSCLNISTFSKNGMLIDVTHKLGYHSSNLISKKKKKNRNQLGFLFLVPIWRGSKKVCWLSSLDQCTQGDELLPSAPLLTVRIIKPIQAFPPGPWNNMRNYFLRKLSAYLTLPTGETHRLSPFWCHYTRIQGLAWPNPKLRRIL